MTGSDWRLRLRSSLQATITGWLAGVIVTLPIQAGVAWRNTDGQLAMMAQTLALGILIWSIWTLIFSLLGWLLLIAPLALILPLAWLRAHKLLAVATVCLTAIALPGYNFGLYTIFDSVQLFDEHNFFVYAIFGASFAAVFLLRYLRLSSSSEP